jgi:hypothetical protein
MGDVQWLAFTPRYQSTRRADGRPVVGAHAFAPGAARSVCAYVARESAGPEADPSARRCARCEGTIAFLARQGVSRC